MQSTKVETHITKRFNLLKKIGSGAYGHVWKVVEKSTKKVYALKKIFDAFQHATDAQRTYREVNILSQLSHDNIIQLKETIKAENQKDLYLLFEYMDADLHNVIAEGILKTVHSRYIIYQIAKSLKYLHSAKLIHRDLKPSNVLLNSACLVKLCDFGLVRCIDAEDQSTDVMTENVATRWYRAPEVLMGSRSYGYPVDVWSFGCIIYEIYFKKPLFNGNSTLEQLEQIVRFTGYPSVEDLNSLESDYARTMIAQTKLQNVTGKAGEILSEAPPEISQIIKRMVVFNPKRRIQIEDVLEHNAVKDFRKPVSQTTCQSQIKTDLNDNKKLTVDQYRLSIYKPNKSKSLSTNKLPFKVLVSPKAFMASTSNQNFLKRDPKPDIKVVRSSENLQKGLVSPTTKSASKVSKVFGSAKVNTRPSETKPVDTFQKPKITKELSKTTLSKTLIYNRTKKLGDDSKLNDSKSQGVK